MVILRLPILIVGTPNRQKIVRQYTQRSLDPDANLARKMEEVDRVGTRSNLRLDFGHHTSVVRRWDPLSQSLENWSKCISKNFDADIARF